MEISYQDLSILVHLARKDATDITNQIIDEIVNRVNEQS
jgi:hypothetical protein